MPAIARSRDVAAIPAVPLAARFRRLLRALAHALDRLLPPHRADGDDVPPQFYRYPPF